MEPFVALMRRYVVDYTNRHDTAVCRDIMEPGYTLRMGAHVLSGRDDQYIPAVEAQFRQFPGLGLTVHELVTNGEQLAMSFSEQGASVAHGGAKASWAGVALYRWNGTRLVENFVEQDYLSRKRQLSNGMPKRVGAPALAPWDTVSQPVNPSAEAAVQGWIADGLPGDCVRVDDGSPGARMQWCDTEVDFLFSAGDRVAFRITRHGEYLGGIDELDDSTRGQLATLRLAGLVQVHGGEVVAGQIVTDRLGLVRALAGTRPAQPGEQTAAR